MSESSSTLKIPTARVFLPLLADEARYRAAHGGRGSGKSFCFADLILEKAMTHPGLRAVCIREVQKDLKESAKLLIEDRLKVHDLGTAQGFRVLTDRIETPGGGMIIFRGMQDYNSESIKSLENFQVAWVEEAQTLSEVSLRLLRPTIRAPGSEIWFSWNPRRKVDPVDQMFRQRTPPAGSIVVEANWDDNPWFTDTLEAERVDCLENDPDDYDHVWGGGYVGVSKNAYYARQLATARQEHRIGKVARDPILSIHLLCDIGGTGAKADSFSIWAQQWVGQEIRNLKYYEVQGQEVGYHLDWMADNDYTPGRTTIWLPHDGKTQDRVYDFSYESAFKAAGYDVVVVPNQGTGAAMSRIQAARRKFPQMYFDQEDCEDGLLILGAYHPKIHKVTGMDLGPDHDWASHGADAFGLGAIVHTPARGKGKKIDFDGWN